MIKNIFLTILLTLFCFNCYAAPSPSSVSGNDISGSSFGAKSPAEPYLWADFDTDLSPSNLGTVSSWDNIDSIVWDSDEGINETGGMGAFKLSREKMISNTRKLTYDSIPNLLYLYFR